MADPQFIKVPDLPQTGTPDANALVLAVLQTHVVVRKLLDLLLGAGIPAGPDKAVQFRNGNAIDGNDGLTFTGNVLVVQAPGGGVGWLGIGTDAPEEHLHLVGKIRLDDSDASGHKLTVRALSDGTNTFMYVYNPTLGTPGVLTYLWADPAVGTGHRVQFVGGTYTDYVAPGVGGSGVAAHNFDVTASLSAGDRIARFREGGAVRLAVRADGTLDADGTASASAVGAVVGVWPISDATGSLVGYIPIYDSFS